MKKNKIDSQTVETLFDSGFTGYWKFVSKKPLMILLYALVIVMIIYALYNLFTINTRMSAMEQEFNIIKKLQQN